MKHRCRIQTLHSSGRSLELGCGAGGGVPPKGTVLCQQWCLWKVCVLSFPCFLDVGLQEWLPSEEIAPHVAVHLICSWQEESKESSVMILVDSVLYLRMYLFKLNKELLIKKCIFSLKAQKHSICLFETTFMFSLNPLPPPKIIGHYHVNDFGWPQLFIP